MIAMRLLIAIAATVATISVAEPSGAAAREGGAQPENSANALRDEARSLATEINTNYAYLDRLPEQRFDLTPPLQREAEAIEDKRDLLRFVERSLLLLADHHAIAGSSFANSWAVVPSYSDLWIERLDGEFVISAVRSGSPAQRAGIIPGSALVSIGEVPTGQAVSAFWGDLGTQGNDVRDGFAARVLAAGRRDRARELGVRLQDGTVRHFNLPNLYMTESEKLPPVSVSRTSGVLQIRFNNSLGDAATIAAFDAAMAEVADSETVLLDLTDTPSGGNTTVARAILGWFADRPTAYQMHAYPAEERQTGIARQWIELVLPRKGRHHSGPVTVRVGRWTGSMGEGLALGMAELGACVEGDAMAGLLGAITDFRLGESNIIFKLPNERLMAVDGTPRERFHPAAHCPSANGPRTSSADPEPQAGGNAGGVDVRPGQHQP